MTKREYPGNPGLLPGPIMRRLLDVACEFQRLSPWQIMWDTAFVGSRDERTRELRICSVLGRGNEVFGMLSYRGADGVGLAHALVTQEHEPSTQQLLRGMDCIKVEFSPKHRDDKVWPEQLARRALGRTVVSYQRSHDHIA